MKTREYKVWFSINVELPEDEDPMIAYRAAKFNLMNNKKQPYSSTVYDFGHIQETRWYRGRDTVIRTWDHTGYGVYADTQIAQRIRLYRLQAEKQAKEEAEKLKQQVQESAPGIAP